MYSLSLGQFLEEEILAPSDHYTNFMTIFQRGGFNPVQDREVMKDFYGGIDYWWVRQISGTGGAENIW